MVNVRVTVVNMLVNMLAAALTLHSWWCGGGKVKSSGVKAEEETVFLLWLKPSA